MRMVTCPAARCGHPNRPTDDGLGRVFRCVRCHARLSDRAEVRGPALEPDRHANPAEAIDSFDGVPLARPSASLAGTRLGRYHLLGLLGSGSFASVYRASDPDLERDVALKVLREGAADQERIAGRFQAEAKALARLAHPHIVAVHEVGSAGPHRFLAMKLVEGPTLDSLIAQGPAVPERAAEIVATLADALAHAHELGVVHRDVKPANVVIDRAGKVNLMDFGLAHRDDSNDKLTLDGAILGTPAYVAPEQAVGGSGAHPSGDQYALGVILYELLTGRRPFVGSPSVVLYQAVHQAPPPPRSIDPSIPRRLEAICLKAMARRPEDRFSTCRELAEALGAPTGEDLPKSDRATRLIRLLRTKAPRPLAAGLAAAGLLGLGMFFASVRPQAELSKTPDPTPARRVRISPGPRREMASRAPIEDAFEASLAGR